MGWQIAISLGLDRDTYDKGDHLHPQDDGYKAMAESIDLALLTGKK
jgi:lysophospholipase L1-like esterase